MNQNVKSEKSTKVSSVEDSIDADVIRAEISLEMVSERFVACLHRLGEEKPRGVRVNEVILAEMEILRDLDERVHDTLRDLRLYKQARGMLR